MEEPIDYEKGEEYFQEIVKKEIQCPNCGQEGAVYERRRWGEADVITIDCPHCGKKYHRIRRI